MADAFTIETSLNFQYEILVRSETIHARVFAGNINRFRCRRAVGSVISDRKCGLRSDRR
jgi:hypothetical protein